MSTPLDSVCGDFCIGCMLIPVSLAVGKELEHLKYLSSAMRLPNQVSRGLALLCERGVRNVAART